MRVDYGETAALGSSTPEEYVGDGAGPVDVAPVSLTGLLGARTYHYRLVATRNGAVVATGAQRTFTTPPDPRIVSAGPLNRIATSTTLSCDVRYVTDAQPEFFSGNACGTFAVVAGTLYTPVGVPLGPGGTALTPVSQSLPTGSGTAADPYQLRTVVAAGATGVRLVQTDAYVVGEESFRTDVVVENTSGSPQPVRLYRAGDCFLNNSDSGFGARDPVSGAVACVGGSGGQPTSRIEQFYPLTAGAHHYEAGYSQVWTQIGNHAAFPDTCRCTEPIDNGAGLSWDVTVPAHGTQTVSSLLTFSPLGHVPLSVGLHADSPTTPAGGGNGYTITVRNPNASPVALDAITADLPPGFAYRPGTTSGATTANPSIAGGHLTWAGPITVPAGGQASIHFGVTAPAGTGTGTAQAGAVAAGFTIVSSGRTAAVQVTPAVPPGPADLRVGVSLLAGHPLVVGKESTYRFSITNAGPSAAVGVVLRVTLPPGLRYVSATPGPCTVSRQVVSCPVGGLAVGARAEIRMRVRAVSTAAGRLAVSVTGAGFDPAGGSNAVALAAGAAPPAPVPARTVNLASVSGRVRVKLPGSRRYQALERARSVPVGTIVDATRGRVRITSARDAKGHTQAADFYEGAFRITQRRARPLITELTLYGGDFSGCRPSQRAAARAARRRKGGRGRHLWGNGKGKFRTRGRYGAATVRGTIWLTEDRCAATRVKVARGVVAVRDFTRGKTVTVRTGRSYSARAPRRR